MKPVFLLVSLFFATFFHAAGQETLPPTSAPVAIEAIQAGNWMVGGSLGSAAFNLSTGTFQLNLQPSAGYFISNQIALGSQAILGLTAYEGGTNFTYGLAPFGRYYFREGARASGRWFGEVTAGISGSSLVDSESDDVFSLLFGLGVGYAHFVGENVALEGKAGYTFTEADIVNSTISSGLGITLGFQIYLPGRQNR